MPGPAFFELLLFFFEKSGGEGLLEVSLWRFMMLRCARRAGEKARKEIGLHTQTPVTEYRALH